VESTIIRLQNQLRSGLQVPVSILQKVALQMDSAPPRSPADTKLSSREIFLTSRQANLLRSQFRL